MGYLPCQHCVLLEDTGESILVSLDTLVHTIPWQCFCFSCVLSEWGSCSQGCCGKFLFLLCKVLASLGGCHYQNAGEGLSKVQLFLNTACKGWLEMQSWAWLTTYQERRMWAYFQCLYCNSESILVKKQSTETHNLQNFPILQTVITPWEEATSIC
jgi:hypothetical protein